MQEDALTLIDHALAAFGQSPDHLWLVVEHAVESCPRGLTAIDAALDIDDMAEQCDHARLELAA